MDWDVKDLLHIHESPSSNPHHPWESLVQCNASVSATITQPWRGRAETDGSLKLSWQPVQGIMSLDSVGDPVSKTVRQRTKTPNTALWLPHMCACGHVKTWTCMCPPHTQVKPNPKVRDRTMNMCQWDLVYESLRYALRYFHICAFKACLGPVC